jgi:hypothetical protein
MQIYLTETYLMDCSRAEVHQLAQRKEKPRMETNVIEFPMVIIQLLLIVAFSTLWRMRF